MSFPLMVKTRPVITVLSQLVYIPMTITQELKYEILHIVLDYQNRNLKVTIIKLSLGQSTCTYQIRMNSTVSSVLRFVPLKLFLLFHLYPLKDAIKWTYFCSPIISTIAGDAARNNDVAGCG